MRQKKYSLPSQRLAFEVLVFPAQIRVLQIKIVELES